MEDRPSLRRRRPPVGEECPEQTTPQQLPRVVPVVLLRVEGGCLLERGGFERGLNDPEGPSPRNGRPRRTGAGGMSVMAGAAGSHERQRDHGSCPTPHEPPACSAIWSRAGRSLNWS